MRAARRQAFRRHLKSPLLSQLGHVAKIEHGRLVVRPGLIMLAFLRWVRSAKLDWFGKMICADELGSFGQVRRGRATHDRAINGSPAIRLRDAACTEIIRFSGFVLRGRFGALSLGRATGDPRRITFWPVTLISLAFRPWVRSANLAAPSRLTKRPVPVSYQERKVGIVPESEPTPLAVRRLKEFAQSSRS
jgi:hypothetical protein